MNIGTIIWNIITVLSRKFIDKFQVTFIIWIGFREMGTSAYSKSDLRFIKYNRGCISIINPVIGGNSEWKG